MIIYRNTSSDFVSTFYYQPFDLEVSGRQVLGLQPKAKDHSKAEIFDFDFLRNLSLSSVGESDFQGYKTAKFNFDPVGIDLQPLQNYPLFVTIGNIKEDLCGATIDGKGCSEFINQ